MSPAMSPVQRPHRVTFLPPILTLGPGDDRGRIYGELLNQLAFQLLAPHPVVAMTDPEDRAFFDRNGTVLDANHAELGQLLDWETRVARRDEVLWIEATLVPGASAMPRLHIRSTDGSASVFTGGGGTFAGGLAGALEAWLEARFLPPPTAARVGFTGADVRAAGEWLELTAVHLADKARDATVLTTPPAPALAVAGLRALARLAPGAVAVRGQIDAMVLELDPDHPALARSHIAQRLADGDKAAKNDARRLVELYPQQGKIHLLFAGDDVTVAEELGHQATAATLLPESPVALDQYASALLRAGRFADAHRAAARATAVDPRHVKAHCDRVRALRSADRAGDAFRDARAGWNQLNDLWNGQRLVATDEPNLRWAQHLMAAAHFEVGRLDEAIVIARRALDGAPAGAYRHQRAELDFWERDASALAAAFTRDGLYRREPGRVLEGLARGRPLRGLDVAADIDALIAVGKDDLAPLAWAHHDGAGRASGPVAWLGGARACLLGDDLDEAARLFQRAQLAPGAAMQGGAVNRVLRLAAAWPAAAWEAVIADRLDAGALTLARLLARDLADFVPGLERSGLALQALGPRAPRPFDERCLDGLRAALGGVPFGAIDTFFAQHTAANLTAADRLAGGWLDCVAPGLTDEARTGQIAYLFVSALARYLILTAAAPNPLAGGLRQVATDALALLGQSAPMSQGLLRAVLETIDGVADGLDDDDWILDSWLLRFERTVALDDRLGGHLGGFTFGLRKVSGLLRGDERIAFELRLAHALKDDGDPTNDDQARLLFERSLRAVGSGAAAPWVEITAGLPPPAALDIFHTAATAAPRESAPQIALARTFFINGNRDRAFATLLGALPLLDLQMREFRLADLKTHWLRAGMEIPFDWAPAQDAGLAHLAAGQPAEAARCFRWCNALDPGNPGILKNLGLALAALGETNATVRAFSEMDEADGPKLAGHALLQAQRYQGAVLALRYASSAFIDAADWATLGGAAWYEEDDEAAADAYAKVYEMKRGHMEAPELATFATALANAGNHARCEEVARELMAAAFDDPVLLAAGNHAMARALLGQGRNTEAATFAQLAMKGNPGAENIDEIADTLARAQRGQPYAARQLRGDTAARRAFAAVETGDFPAALAIAGSAPGWDTARAALVAGAARTDPHGPVGYAALQALSSQLGASDGATDREATLWRILALALREDATFPADASPPLGARMELDLLDQKLGERLEDDEPTIMKEVPSGPTLKEIGNQPTHRMPQTEPIPVEGDDLLVFPGSKIPRLSDYIEVMKAMRGQDPLGALAKLGLDMAGYAQLATQWGQKLAADPELSAQLRMKMSEP